MKKYLIILVAFLLSCSSQKKIVDKSISSSEVETISYSVSGEGETLVFIHAGGLDKNMWQNQISEFNKKAKVIAYDIRGHGKSQSKTNSKLEIDDLSSILEKEQIKKKINLVGCSLGAIIALDYAIAYPDKIKSLTLVSPGLLGFQERDAEFLSLMTEYVKAVESNDRDEMIEKFKKVNAVGKIDRNIGLTIDTYLDENLNAYIESGNYLRVPKFKTLQPLEEIGKLQMKCLIIYGEIDFDYVKRNATELNSKIQNSELYEFKNAGHLPNLEDRVLFNEVLQNFL